MKKKIKRTDTEVYRKKMQKKLENKLWKELRAKIIERDNGCCICHDRKLVHLHHLLPRQIKEFKFDEDNLVALCPLHHKYSYSCSPHKNPIAFIDWLYKNKKEQFDKLKNKYFKLI